MNNPIPSRTGYIPTLDGWRAVAILAVLAAHDRPHALGLLSTSFFRRGGAESGVDLFFALSGLLICSRLLEEERLRGRIHLAGFYIRRLCRIQPAALLFLATVATLMLVHVLDWLPEDLLASLLLVRNYFPIDGGQHSWYTGHFWSLSVEEHFYLFLPGFLLLVRRYRALLLLGLAALVELWRVIVGTHVRLHFGPYYQIHTDTAAGTILFAAATAVLLEQATFRRWCMRFLHPWLALVYAVSVHLLGTVYSGHINHPLMVISFSALAASTMLHPATWIGRLLELAPLRFLGRLSYSLYLWQMLFFVHLQPLEPPHSQLLRTIQDTPLRYICLIAIACASYYLVERPMIKLGHRLARPATPGREDLDEVPVSA